MGIVTIAGFGRGGKKQNNKNKKQKPNKNPKHNHLGGVSDRRGTDLSRRLQARAERGLPEEGLVSEQPLVLDLAAPRGPRARRRRPFYCPSKGRLSYPNFVLI